MTTATYDDLDVAPVHDQVAEFSVLACLMSGKPDIIDRAWTNVDPADFYNPTHEALAGIIRELGHVSAGLLPDEIRKHPDSQQVDLMLRLLPKLATDDTHFDEHIDAYATVVRTCARRRNLQRLAQRLAQQATSPINDVDDLVIGLMDAAEGMVTGVTRTLEPSPTADEFIAGDVHYDWLIPGLLERGDRVMLTGAEGGGKSTMTRQFGVCASAGVHPFTAKRFDPISVLIIDLENGRPHLQRKLKPLILAAKAHGDYEPTRLRVESKPSGIDLNELDDAAWFTDKIAAADPDLLIIGPLYRMHALALDKEDAARAITLILDQIRARNRCALIVEAHAGHGFQGHRNWRPTGSSLFMRWPEFGFGLMPDFETDTAKLLPWRGARDERDWPRLLRRGRGDSWPWVETMPEAENNQWRSA